MDIHKDINFFKYAEHAQRLLCTEGVGFNPNGFPDLTRFKYLKEIPDDIEVWPYNKRNQAVDPKKTILVFFETDQSLYGYVNLIDKVVANLSLYYAVAGFDISPCLNSSIEEQNAALLLNSLTNGLILSHGVLVIPSLRIGCAETAMALRSYPRNICYSYGSLGCNQRFQNVGRVLTGLKLALCEPSQILAYGKLSAVDRAMFGQWGTPVMQALDYQTITRKRTMERRRQNV